MGDPRRLYDPYKVLPVLQGPGESQGQDYCRESNFYKDLRSADILNSSQGPSTLPSLCHPTPVWALCCLFPFALRLTVYFSLP